MVEYKEYVNNRIKHLKWALEKNQDNFLSYELKARLEEMELLNHMVIGV